MNPAIVVFSGGQDSTTCLALAIRRHGQEHVSCITFHYGQRHVQEVEVAKKLATSLGIRKHHIVNLDNYADLTRSALLDPTLAITAQTADAPPNTVVDGRNMLFLLLAAVVAKRDGIHDIYTGVCQTDSSGYPDCRDTFIKACNVTLNLAMDYNFQIHTPLMFLNKMQIWALADELGMLERIANETLTCYNGIIGPGCGSCPSCHLRQRGYDAYLKTKSSPCV